MNSTYRLLILLFTVAFSFAAKAATIELEDFKNQPYGFSGVWTNQGGALMGARVLFVKLQHQVTALPGNLYKIDITYPAIPVEVFDNYKLPQVGAAFSCGLRSKGLKLPMKVESVEAFHDNFRNLDPRTAKYDFTDANPNESRICSVTVKVLGAPSKEELTQVDWSLAVTSGLPDLTVRQTKVIEKQFSDIAQPYIDFLKEENINFRTDDEFWFLAAASVHQEPALTVSFMRSTPGYVRNWVTNFALYVVNQVGNPAFQKYIKDEIGSYPIKIETTYWINNSSEEVNYEN